MNLSFVLILVAVYLLYRLIVDFIIPIYKTTKKVKQGFREMQEKMNQHQRSNSAPPPVDASKAKNTKEGDYIDFEEVK